MGSARTRRLLIVEDDDQLRRFLARYLAEWWEVEAAPSGEAALELYQAFFPDAVLSDWVMPGLHGEQFLRALRRLNPAVPIVVMTGKSSEGKLVKSVRLACAYLKKPLSIHEANETLGRCVEEALALQGRAPQQKGRLSFCRWKQQVAVGDEEPATLTAAELQVFLVLWDRVGRIVTWKEIAEAATGRAQPWNADADSISRRFIHQLRKKVEPDPGRPQVIVTVRGQGVKLVIQATG